MPTNTQEEDAGTESEDSDAPDKKRKFFGRKEQMQLQQAQQVAESAGKVAPALKVLGGQ